MSMKFNNTRYGKPIKLVIDSVENNKKTIFSDVNFFNDGEKDYTTIEKLASEEFENITGTIQQVGKLSPIKVSENLMSIFRAEKSHINELEELAIKKVQAQFGIPDYVMNRIHAKITMDIPQKQIYSKQKKATNSFSEDEQKIIKENVEVRLIQNALMMGSGFEAHSTFSSIKEDLDKINPQLYLLYQKTMPNISLLIWQMPFDNMMNQSQSMAVGVSNLEKNKSGEVSAKSSAMMFPILLHETTKVAMELLFSNYIVNVTKTHGEKIAQEIIRQADVPMEELMMKRIGPPLWRYLHNVIDYVIKHDREGDSTLVSYLISKISLMEPKCFISFMNDIVYNGNKSIALINNMIDEIEERLKAYHSTLNITEYNPDGLKEQLAKAIAEDRYEDAAEIKKKIDKL